MDRRPINIRLDPDTFDRLMELAADLKKESGDYRAGAATVAALIIKNFLDKGETLSLPTDSETRKELKPPKQARTR